MNIANGSPADILLMKVVCIGLPILIALIIGYYLWEINQGYKEILSKINVSDILYQEKFASGIPQRNVISPYSASYCLVVVFLKDRFFIRGPKLFMGTIVNYDREIFYSNVSSCTVGKATKYLLLKLNGPQEEYYTIAFSYPSKVIDIFKSKGILIN